MEVLDFAHESINNNLIILLDLELNIMIGYTVVLLGLFQVHLAWGKFVIFRFGGSSLLNMVHPLFEYTNSNSLLGFCKA